MENLLKPEPSTFHQNTSMKVDGDDALHEEGTFASILQQLLFMNTINIAEVEDEVNSDQEDRGILFSAPILNESSQPLIKLSGKLTYCPVSNCIL